jgi:cobalt/nickel transport system permease protein
VKRTLPRSAWCLALAVFLCATSAHAMHISDGILPIDWAGFWWLAALPFVGIGLAVLRRRREADPRAMPLVAMVGAAIFVISCMPVPIPGIGSCAHPCGVGLGALILGPWLTVLVASIALTFQALFLAHGGVTTLGADVISMGVVGAFSAYATFRSLRAMRVPLFAAAMAAGIVSDWATYTTTSWQLAVVLAGDGSVGNMFATIVVAFIPTQLPLGLVEGIMTAVAYRFVLDRRPDLIGLPPVSRWVAGTGA